MVTTLKRAQQNLNRNTIADEQWYRAQAWRCDYATVGAVVNYHQFTEICRVVFFERVEQEASQEQADPLGRKFKLDLRLRNERC
uniref:XRN2-binding (XTBD) domain-containing protein n=1 Tax=Ascaris lumbricoides TaxID=6252 RepID=A0A0M3IPY9_ASCLU